MSNQVQETNGLMIIEGLQLDRVTESVTKINKFQEVVQKSLVEGHDYGAAFKGSSKPSLLKPGAEKILMLMGLSSEYEIIEQIKNYEEGFFAYTIRCILKRGSQVITEGLGHCNSKEKKYDSDKQDKYMLGNTCLKMAKKRAQVDAALTVGSLSNIFTQDLEDMAEFNQSEEIDNMTLEDAGNMKVTFGKYNGKLLKEILENDRGYIQWIADKSREQAMKQAAKMMLSSTSDNKINNNVKKEEPVDLGVSIDPNTGEVMDGDLPF